MPNDLLRNDVETALNDLACACRESADGAALAAERCDDTEIRDWLRALAATRAGDAEALGDYLTEHFDGPNWPDEEKQQLLGAAAGVKAALSPDGVAALLSARRADELRVSECAVAAKDMDLTDGLRGRLARIAEDSQSHLVWIDRRVENDA